MKWPRVDENGKGNIIQRTTRVKASRSSSHSGHSFEEKVKEPKLNITSNIGLDLHKTFNILHIL